jgi:hypothetical protein
LAPRDPSASDAISPGVLRFLETCIDSVEQLRVLLLLHSDPERLWTIGEMTAELRSADGAIVSRLNGLYDRFVLTRLPELKERHKFSPASAEVSKVVTELAAENRLRPHRLIQLIYSGPGKKS